MTLFVGMNNSGKSAILEMLSSQYQANPHRSKRTIPREFFMPDVESLVTFTLVENFDNSFFKGQDASINTQLTNPSDNVFFQISQGLKGNSTISLKKIVVLGNMYRPQQELSFVFQIGETKISNENINEGHFTMYRDTQGNITTSIQPTGNNYTLPNIITDTFLRTVYWCHAKRFVSGISGFLVPDSLM